MMMDMLLFFAMRRMSETSISKLFEWMTMDVWGSDRVYRHLANDIRADMGGNCIHGFGSATI